jgi:hypothetical protein
MAIRAGRDITLLARLLPEETRLASPAKLSDFCCGSSDAQSIWRPLLRVSFTSSAVRKWLATSGAKTTTLVADA